MALYCIKCGCELSESTKSLYWVCGACGWGIGRKALVEMDIDEFKKISKKKSPPLEKRRANDVIIESHLSGE